jgi:hypothetical protein
MHTPEDEEHQDDALQQAVRRPQRHHAVHTGHEAGPGIPVAIGVRQQPAARVPGALRQAAIAQHRARVAAACNGCLGEERGHCGGV